MSLFLKGNLLPVQRLITRITNPVNLPAQLFTLKRHAIEVSVRYLEEWSKHVERVDCTGCVRVGHELVQVASPSFFCIVAHRRLKGGEDGWEEGGRRRGRVGLQRVVSLLLGEPVRTHRIRWLGCVRRSQLSGCENSVYLGKQLSRSSSSL